MLQKTCCSNLWQSNLCLKIRVIDFKTPCFFYRKHEEVFSINEIMPEGVCPDLFFQIYPQYLSLLYGGRPFNKNHELKTNLVSCPGIEGKTIWRIRSKKFLLSPVINLVNRFFRFIGKPKDLFDKKIIIELIEEEGLCPRGRKQKKRFSFNQYSHLWKRRFFCPAVFYTLYPFLISQNSKMQDEDIPLRIQCPSDNSAIMFELIKETP